MSTNKFNQFLKNRQSLIYQYKICDLSKDEFIEENYNYIISMGIEPFKKVDNIKKAIFNYQYYNGLAKYYQRLSRSISKSDKAKKENLDLSLYYYSQKDDVTIKLLKLLDFKGIEAYFVKAKSPKLSKKLFEIVIKDEEILLEINYFSDFYNPEESSYIILHSKNPYILSLLKRENAFLDVEKKSLVDNYINKKY